MKIAQEVNRRLFLSRAGIGLGTLALRELLHLDGKPAWAGAAVNGPSPSRPVRAGELPGLPDLPHFAPKATRIIYLFQSGAPSQMDLFDHKPAIRERRGMELPASVRMGQRITTMTSGQKNLPVAPSIFKFAQHGQ